MQRPSESFQTASDPAFHYNAWKMEDCLRLAVLLSYFLSLAEKHEAV
jgi:hypothetical protein